MSDIRKFSLNVENINDLPKSFVSIKIGYDTPITYRVSFNQMYKFIHSGVLDYEKCKINPKIWQIENGYKADKFRVDYGNILKHVVYCLKTRYNSKMLRFIVLSSIYGNVQLRMMFGSDKAINDYVHNLKFY